jgi:hypothetical protein
MNETIFGMWKSLKTSSNFKGVIMLELVDYLQMTSF